MNNETETETLAWGARGREFKSHRPDHLFLHKQPGIFASKYVSQERRGDSIQHGQGWLLQGGRFLKVPKRKRRRDTV